MLLALIDEPTLESLWHATSSDVDRLRAHIREAAIALDDEDLLASPPLDRIVRAAIFHAMSAGSSVVEAHHLLVRMWPIALEDEPDPMLALLEKHGLTLAAVTTFIAHGVAAHEEWSDATAPAGEPLAVEMLNDDYTPQEVVVHILEDVVRLSPTDAYRLMLKVHMDGRTAVTVLPRNEAIALANAVLAEARNAGAPLKVVLTPPTTAESEGHDATFRAT